MRTTVTLDPDTESLVKKSMRQRRVSFKQAINDAIRSGLGSTSGKGKRFETTALDMGQPAVNLDRALQIAAQLEDDELVRKMQLGK